MVSLDLYVTETNRHADYILPATTFLERDDTAGWCRWHVHDAVLQWTDAVLEPRGEAEQEWEIIERSRQRSASCRPASPLRAGSADWGSRLSPQFLLGVVVRIGPYGDCSGSAAAG